MKIGRTNLFYPRLLAYGIDMVIVIGLCLFPRIGWIFGLIYFLFKDAMPFTKGQSYGRRLFRIRLVKLPNMESVEKYPEKSIIRNIILLIPILNIYEVYLFLFQDQRLGEKWSETVVISTQID
nr:RDD family protein [uncultured Carboxylicivirga sp.]